MQTHSPEGGKQDHPAERRSGQDGSSPPTPENPSLRQQALLAAERLLGGTFTGSVPAPGPRPGRDKLRLVMTIVAVAVGMMLILHLLARRSVPARSQPLVYTPQFDVGMSSQEEIRSFTAKTAKEVTDIARQTSELGKSMTGLIKRQDETERFVKDALTQAQDAFSRLSAEKIHVMEEYAKANHASAIDPRASAIIADFRHSLAEMRESPAEARAHAAQLLRQAGLPEDQVRNLLAEAAQQAGRVAVGDIAERPASPQEIESLPIWVRSRFDSIRDRLGVIGLTSGRLFPEQTWRDVREFLLAREHGRKAELTQELCTRIAEVARVRRENIPAALDDVLPFLLTLREQGHVARDDRAGIAALVWSARERYPSDITAGELVSLCSVVARTVGAVAPAPGETSGFRPLDGPAQAFAIEVVAAALANAVELGKGRAQQLEIARHALNSYLDTARLNASAEQQDAIIMGAQGKMPVHHGSAVAAHAQEQTHPGPVAQPAASPSDQDDQMLYLGPLHLERGRVQQALILALPGLVAASGQDPRTCAGAAAVVAAIEQVPRIVSGDLPAFLGKPLGGRGFLQDAIPQLSYAMRMGESLGRIAVPVAAAGTSPDGQSEQLVRGVAIGAIYGPLLHDEAKARQAAGPALARIEAQAPLTSALAARLAALPPDHPYAAILTALRAVHPGACPVPPGRFQDMVTASTALSAEVGALCEEVRSAMSAAPDPGAAAMAAAADQSEDVSGLFEQDARMLIPLSMAGHDDGEIPVTDLAGLVRTDLHGYAVSFVTETRVSRWTMEVLIPRYAPAVLDGEGNGSALVSQAIAIIAQSVREAFLQDTQPLARALPEEVRSLEQAAQPMVERRLVQEVVLARVLPRLSHAGAAEEMASMPQTLVHIRARVRDLVQPPYTPARIDAWSLTLASEARQQLASADKATSGATGARLPRGAWPAPAMLAPLSGNQHLVGTSITPLHPHQIVIPANTYANAHIQTGVDAEIGGHGNIPVMLQIDFDWAGPGGSRVVMRGCRLSGSANALAGPQRVAIELKQVSYVFPDGRELAAEVKGYVVDNLHGQYGALGTYHWNTEKVLPLAMIAGAGQGAANALKASSTTDIVAVGATTAVADPGAKLTQALSGGVAGGVGIMADYVKAVLNEIHPSVSMVNGQSVSVVLIEPVVLNVPDAEVPSLSGLDTMGDQP